MQKHRNYPLYEFLSKFPFESIRFVIYKNRTRQSIKENLFRLRNSRPSAYREFSRAATSSWQQNESRIREEIACRYAANNAVEKTQNGRFETRSEEFRHRRCSLGILGESPLGQLYGKTAHTRFANSDKSAVLDRELSRREIRRSFLIWIGIFFRICKIFHNFVRSINARLI